MSGGGGPSSAQTRPGWARGECDRCGQWFKLNDLKIEYWDQRPNGLLVCESCWDEDQPQLQLGKIKIYDPISLRDPRPDISRVPSTSYFGWEPCGNPINAIYCKVGQVIVPD